MKRLALITALLCAGTCPAPGLAERPAEGTGTLTGTLQGRHGNRVRLVYRELPTIIERGNGWEETRPRSHSVRLGAGGTLSIPVPGCPSVYRVVGCAGTTYEAWATYNGHVCSDTSLIMNVTTGESNKVQFFNAEANRVESLICSVATANKTKG